MALDLKIFDVTSGGPMVASTWPHPDAVGGEYDLIQRIAKNLLTNPGEDQFDPDWGAGIHQSMLGIPGQQQDLAEQAATAALQKCLRDIQSDQMDDPASRLVSLRLRALVYDPLETSWTLSVDVETEERVLTIEAGV